MLRTPSTDQSKLIAESFLADLASFSYHNATTRELEPIVCCICDGIPKKPQWWSWIDTNELALLCHHSNLHNKRVAGFYNRSLLSQYELNSRILSPYILSPCTIIREKDSQQEACICNECKSALRHAQENTTHKYAKPPKGAIANGFLLGDPPKELTCLNEIELSLISKIKIHSQSWVFFAGCHKHIKGWHSLYHNRHEANVANLRLLHESGLRGNVLVILCGPFTETQYALTLAKTKVDVDKVIAAFTWLKANNYHYANDEIPAIGDIPLPVVLKEKFHIHPSADVDIENQIDLTVVFPDASTPAPTNGGFTSQDEFRAFVAKHQDGKWDSAFIARPTAEQAADYMGDTIAPAFPLLFPYGHSGLQEDPAVISMATTIIRNKEHMKRKRMDVLRKFLQHRKPEFHTPMFNLIVSNLIMKETIFHSTRMYCNTKRKDETKMGEHFGMLSAAQLEDAIQQARCHRSVQHSSEPKHQYLKSIQATCRSLPHSNEASLEARRIYFSFLIMFGLPCIFLTITPDDKRSFRIRLYSMAGKEVAFGEVDVNTFSDADIIDEFHLRENIRVDYPGLCAEEYSRIVSLVIKHIFGWDESGEKAPQMGLFGELLAWCLATEEQGRKTLHGHFLLFVKDWEAVMTVLQRRKGDKKYSGLSLFEAVRRAKHFHRNSCSANLFEDFRPGGDLSQQPVFFHACARKERKEKQMRYTPVPVSDQILRAMRHKVGCHEHKGHIASCGKCDRKFTVYDTVATALLFHFGTPIGTETRVPDRSKRLDRHVYEMGKNMEWTTENSIAKARRYFAANGLVNVHLVTHVTNRCFRKGPECYANLPDAVSPSASILFDSLTSSWGDYLGRKEERTMFRFIPCRSIEDVFMNTHNPILTKLLLCNNNVMVGMNGQSVFYVTGYNAKQNQDEEKMLFEKVANVMVRSIHNQETNPDPDRLNLPEYQKGFRRMLAGVYTHSSSYITAAPMAHYLALYGSRFRYSHKYMFLPAHGIEQSLLGEKMILRLVNNGRARVHFHAAMDWLHRPAGFRGMCVYQYYSQIEFITSAEAKNRHLEEFWEFTKEHPLHGKRVAVYRETVVVPVFAWNWLGATRDFESSLCAPVCKTAVDYTAKELYARRFMILFFPFEDPIELQVNGSYQLALKKAMSDRRIDSDMFAVADRIQAIHNSLNSTTPENILSAETELQYISENRGQGSPQESTYQSLIQDVASLLAEASQASASLSEEPVDLFPLGAIPPQQQQVVQDPPTIPPPLQNVILTEDEGTSRGATVPPGNENSRFRATTYELNTLVMRNFMTSANRQDREDRNVNPNALENLTVEANGSWQSIILCGMKAGLDAEQQQVLQMLLATYVLTFYNEADPSEEATEAFEDNHQCLRRLARIRTADDPPLCLFVTGPAGAGKSKILEELMAYAKLFSQQIGHQFTRNTIRMTAMTGAAASEIGGDTTSKEFQLKKNMNFAKTEDLESFKDTRMHIVDEISFMDHDTELRRLSEHLRMFTECNKFTYGKHAIVFLGDFCQLRCVAGISILERAKDSLYWEKGLTHMIELKGTHRYKDCPLMQEIMTTMRLQGLSAEHRAILDSRVISPTLPGPALLDARSATFHNAKRDAIHRAVFKQYLQTYHQNCDENNIPTSAIVIKAHASFGMSGTPFNYGNRKLLFEHCSEANIVNEEKKRADPLLCCHFDCPMMNNLNDSVKDGKANGTTSKFQKVLLKPGKSPHPIKLYGYWVYAVNIEDVEHMILRWEGSVFEGTFKMKPRNKTFWLSNFPIDKGGRTWKDTFKIKLKHFALVRNQATTGHKLQGKTVSELIVAEWSDVKNWAYVVMSRVRTLAGLFFTEAIPTDIDFAPEKIYTKMMERLRERILVAAGDIVDLECLVTQGL